MTVHRETTTTDKSTGARHKPCPSSLGKRGYATPHHGHGRRRTIDRRSRSGKLRWSRRAHPWTKRPDKTTRGPGLLFDSLVATWSLLLRAVYTCHSPRERLSLVLGVLSDPLHPELSSILAYSTTAPDRPQFHHFVLLRSNGFVPSSSRSFSFNVSCLGLIAF